MLDVRILRGECLKITANTRKIKRKYSEYQLSEKAFDNRRNGNTSARRVSVLDSFKFWRMNRVYAQSGDNNPVDTRNNIVQKIEKSLGELFESIQRLFEPNEGQTLRIPSDPYQFNDVGHCCDQIEYRANVLLNMINFDDFRDQESYASTVELTIERIYSKIIVLDHHIRRNVNVGQHATAPMLPDPRLDPVDLEYKQNQRPPLTGLNHLESMRANSGSYSKHSAARTIDNNPFRNASAPSLSRLHYQMACASCGKDLTRLFVNV